MGERPRRHDEIRGATVLLTGWSQGREHEIADALGAISTEPVDLDDVELPVVALPKVTLEKAEAARGLLIEAGGSVESPRNGRSPREHTGTCAMGTACRPIVTTMP